MIFPEFIKNVQPRFIREINLMFRRKHIIQVDINIDIFII